MRHKFVEAGRALFILGLLAAGFLAGGCATVRPWEREKLALEPMAADGARCQWFEHNNEVYREGAVGANGGKSGGGCGCT
jgi:Domain of unknown function (DUF4266)